MKPPDANDRYRAGRLPRDPTDGTEPYVLRDAEPNNGRKEPARARPLLVRMDTVTPVEVRFLSHPRIPLGRLTLLAGDGGLGKSTVALDCAARVTQGLPMFGDEKAEGGTPSPVLVIQAEDGLADTVQPRLVRAGANLALVSCLRAALVRLPGEEKDREVGFTLADRDFLEDAIRETEPRLVVVDPLLAFLGAEVDAHRMNETRPILAGIAALAEVWEASLFGLMHFNKGTGAKALYRLLGSVDFGAAARSVLAVVPHPEDRDDVGRRLIVHVKSNLARKAPTVGFTVSDTGVLWTGRANFTEGDVMAAELRVGRGTKRDAAVEYLKDALRGGERPAKQLYTAALAAGIKPSALKRASFDLMVEKRKDGKSGPWLWRFPDGEDDGTGEKGSTTQSPSPSAPSGETTSPSEGNRGSRNEAAIPSTQTTLPVEGTEGERGDSSRERVPLGGIVEGTEGSRKGGLGSLPSRNGKAARPRPVSPGELFPTAPDVSGARRLRDEGGR